LAPVFVKGVFTPASGFTFINNLTLATLELQQIKISSSILGEKFLCSSVEVWFMFLFVLIVLRLQTLKLGPVSSKVPNLKFPEGCGYDVLVLFERYLSEALGHCHAILAM
jgi:hypothetical protein